MTAQLPDIIELDGEKLALRSNPLEPYLASHPPRPKQFRRVTTACHRGYVAQWRINNDELWLTAILPAINLLRHPVHAMALLPAEPADDDRPIHEQLGLDLPSLATWFTGDLRIPQGDLLEYHHHGYSSLYEGQRILTIQEGVVVGDRTERVPQHVLDEHRARQRRAEEAARQEELREREHKRRITSLAQSLSAQWPTGCRIQPDLWCRLHDETTILKTLQLIFETEDEMEFLWGPIDAIEQAAHDSAFDMSVRPRDHLRKARGAYDELCASVRATIDDDDDLLDELQELLSADWRVFYLECRRILMVDEDASPPAPPDQQ